MADVRIDKDFYKRLRRSESTAIEAWFDEHADPLFGFVYIRVNRNREVARDVTQQTLQLGLKNIKKFDPERGAMSTWLRVLSLNEIRRARRRFVRELPLQDSHLEGGEDLTELPLETLARAETREQVDFTLDQLPEHYREALLSHYVEDASLADIAARTNSNVSAVKPLLHRAREAFRREFQRIQQTTTRPVTP